MNFNSHAHVERDFTVEVDDLLPSHFNSHAHVERDSTHCIFLLSLINFNSHAHVERDDCRVDKCGTVGEFQLTRSRGA